MNITATILIAIGIFFFLGGAVGIIRFPDFYSRLHPAGKLDTAGLLFTMSGMAVYTIQDFTLGAVITSLKIILIVVFIFLTSPVATHAIIDAGFVAGLKPWTKQKEEDSQ